jgi:bifunctional non-homologous end joining protein LigD
VEGDGRAFLDRACALGLEGIVSKRSDRPYRHGRTSDWVKAKCSRQQEFVVGGFTDPEGTRAGLGALLIGYYDDDEARLVFAGKVGTGFTHRFAVELRERLDRMAQRECPFVPPPPRAIARHAHWVKPELVCQVTFTEWTSDGMIRHPSFQGLRADKPARSVRAEREHAPRAAAPRAAARRSSSSGRHAGRAPTDDSDTVCGVHISHPDRVLYHDPPIRKIDLARFYEAIAPWVVPHVAGRPLTLVRCPTGMAGRCFYMKHSRVWAPEPLRRVTIPEKTKRGEYLIADDAAGVVALVQMGVLEIHTWNSTADDVERPNRLVIDLDPGDEVSWPRVVEAARLVRKVLAALELESFCKTTGGRGLHVVAPLVPAADWSECLEFARAIGAAIERTDPAAYTTAYAKRGRASKILLDYLRNNRTNTSIAAYSTRARPGAPVSVPIGWDELRTGPAPASLTVTTLPQRLARLKADPWRHYWTSRQKLTDRRIRAVRGLSPSP